MKKRFADRPVSEEANFCLGSIARAQTTASRLVIPAQGVPSAALYYERDKNLTFSVDQRASKGEGAQNASKLHDFNLLDRMASREWETACPLGIIDYMANHAEPQIEHEGALSKEWSAGTRRHLPALQW